MNSSKIQEDNYKIFALMSHYLNHAPDFITKEKIAEMVSLGVTEKYAFRVLLAASFGLDIADRAEDRMFFENYFTPMIRLLDTEEYKNNPYYQHIKISDVTRGDIQLTYQSYKPYEAFVWNDIVRTKEGRQIPQVGFFNKEFSYPAILEKGRIWMTITPNEVETMKEPIHEAFGNVLTYGLGLGYYAYMVSEKENVAEVTIVEINPDVIDIFQTYLLPQFPQAHKIKIVQGDAFQFAEKEMPKGNYDFVFTDLWHDVSDGLDMYLRMKKYESLCPNTTFSYWIEKSILCYL